jgi:hypothetical protein
MIHITTAKTKFGNPIGEIREDLMNQRRWDGIKGHTSNFLLVYLLQEQFKFDFIPLGNVELDIVDINNLARSSAGESKM